MTEPSELDPDDGLAAALGKLVREREDAEIAARAPEWEAVLAGELELDAAVEQRREAGDDGDELDRAAAYFQPFDAGETASLVDGLLAGLATSSDADADADAEPADAEPADAENVIPFAPKPKPEPAAETTSETSPPAHDPGKSSFWWIPGGMLAAAAAAIALWWVWPRDGSLDPGDTGPTTIAQRDPLPAFALETDGGLRVLRGDESDEGDEGDESSEDPAKALRYKRETPFSWVLRPAVSTAESIELRAFALVDGGSAGLPLDLGALTQIADSGAIRIAGEARQLGLEPGRYTIVLAVGRPDALPADAAAVSAPGEDAPWQAQRVEIQIED